MVFTMKKAVLSTVCVVLIGSCLMGCSTRQNAPSGSNITGTEPLGGISQVAEAQYGGGSDTHTATNYRKETFKSYQNFGLDYDAVKDELHYNGKLVRWFEDYYPVGDNAQAGNDFFNENGVVDVYAVRDLSSFVTAEDGSIDPSGKLTGLKEFSQEDFDSRNIEIIKNPPPMTAIAGDLPTTAEMEEIASEYEPFGVTYDAKNGQWVFNGEKVRYFRDVLTSNGENLNSGKFSGAMRTLGNGNGTVDIFTTRDFSKPNNDDTGSLTGIKKYSQQEFDSHTQDGKSNGTGYGVSVASPD